MKSKEIVIIHIEGGKVQAVTATDSNTEIIIIDSDVAAGEQNYCADYEAGVTRRLPDVADQELAERIDAHLTQLGIIL